MSHNDNRNSNRFARRSGATRRVSGALFCATLLLMAAAGDARAAPTAPENDALTRQASPSNGKGAHDAAASSLSKFEARRVRHTCQQRANDRALKGSDRDAFLARCFFGRSAHRAARRECFKQGRTKGLDKAALHEFVRECAKEPRPR